MDKEYKLNIQKELSFYDNSLKAKFLKYESSLIASYIYHMRLTAYYGKSTGSLAHLLYVYHCYRQRRLSFKTGLQIGPNSCGWGVKIWHIGPIIINDSARIGNNLTIFPGCVIGHNGIGKTPIIGDNCLMIAGSKVYGDVLIGNNVTIAANSVVRCSFMNNCIVGGVPAKLLKMKR